MIKLSPAELLALIRFEGESKDCEALFGMGSACVPRKPEIASLQQQFLMASVSRFSSCQCVVLYSTGASLPQGLQWFAHCSVTKRALIVLILSEGCKEGVVCHCRACDGAHWLFDVVKASMAGSVALNGTLVLPLSNGLPSLDWLLGKADVQLIGATF